MDYETGKALEKLERHEEILQYIIKILTDKKIMPTEENKK